MTEIVFKITPNLKSQVFILCESENFARTASFLFNYSQRGVTYDALMRQALSAFLSHHCASCLKKSEFIIAVTSDVLRFWMYAFCMLSLIVPAFQAAQSISNVINRHNFIQGIFQSVPGL